MLTGPALIADIDACRPPPGQFALWWLGQHGFALKLAGTVVYIDAYLTPSAERLVPPLLAPGELTNADLVLGTHDHSDHIDRPAWPVVAQAAPQATFVVPLLLRDRLAAELHLPPARLVGLDHRQTWERAGVRITGIKAAHEELDPDPVTGHHPALGYVIEGGGAAVYHSGDCCPYDGLAAELRRWELDLMLLPINGRDAARRAAGIIGNMDAEEAAALAGRVRPRCVIPTHYDMFAANPGDPRALAGHMRRKYPDVRVHVCSHGTRVLLPGRA